MANLEKNTHSKHAASILEGPRAVPAFKKALNDLVAQAKKGHSPSSEVFNPTDQWLIQRMPVYQDLPEAQRSRLLKEYTTSGPARRAANSQGKAARRAGPEVVFRLDTGGLAFYSQLGVARRPDLTQYFIDGFSKNRDALSFSEASQELFAEVFPYITRKMESSFRAGKDIIQSDRRIADAPDRSFHARQLLFGIRYLQAPYMWRQLTFPLPKEEWTSEPDILEVSVPNWLQDLGLPAKLIERVKKAGLTQLVFKAPTVGLSLHLGFDYLGEHKMGPLSITMFKVKEQGGLALQAALSVARARTIKGGAKNTALVTTGPSLHGKSTMTIMLELANSALSQKLKLQPDRGEGVYPMNDDIILIQKLARPIGKVAGGREIKIPYSIDGTENNFYAVPFGLTREDDPITYDVVRGTKAQPNKNEIQENVPVKMDEGRPDFQSNPVRNMRMIMNRSRLLERKGSSGLLNTITNGGTKEGVHVPMESIDRVFWQGVMRQNTVVPPLRRLGLSQYVRVLMYGEAVQMGAAIGAIGAPYVEYFSDPFIIGLEDDNATLLYRILKEIERGGLEQHFYVFNTGGVGADTNDKAQGARYRKIEKELTLMLQEGLLRDAVVFEHDDILGSDIAVAIKNDKGETLVDLKRGGWLPRHIYGDADYKKRTHELAHRRYYGKDAGDKAGILRYTEVANEVFDIDDIPAPTSERELSELLSFYWHLDQPYSTLADVSTNKAQGQKPGAAILNALKGKVEAAVGGGLALSAENKAALRELGVGV
ncbi:MAG: hypothetical protein FJ320_08470 [SAR202 cluster bacterium]|nr:hypothetical protein [SAR202 cluster bacterium]